MFRHFYTTAMCPQWKVIEKRFVQIRKAKRIKKCASFLSLVVAMAILTTSVFASGLLLNAVSGGYAVEAFKGKEKLGLVNAPFVENGEIYFPLRETFEKFGIMDNENSKIEWNDGRISLVVATAENAYVTGDTPQNAGEQIVSILCYYAITIGQRNFEINPLDTLPPGKESAAATKELANPPVLKDSVTYVPFEFIRHLASPQDIFSDLNFVVYDQNGNEVYRIPSVGPDTLTLSEEDTPGATTSQPVSIEALADLTRRLFSYFENGDYEGMKTLCTPDCVESFFRDDYVFGMEKAKLVEIGTASGGFSTNGNSKWSIFVRAEVTLAPESVWDPSSTQAGFYLLFEKQPDGTYLIDEFATGL